MNSNHSQSVHLPVDVRETIEIQLQEENQEELLVAWLNELLFQLSTRLFAPKDFHIDAIDSTKISATIKGENLDSEKHAIISEIKSATYHELEIRKMNEGFEAEVILDT